MRLRYGVKSPVLSSLIIARDEEGAIIGCVGLEQAIVRVPFPPFYPYIPHQSSSCLLGLLFRRAVGSGHSIVTGLHSAQSLLGHANSLQQA